MINRICVVVMMAAGVVLAGCGGGGLFGGDADPRGPQRGEDEYHPSRNILEAYDLNHDGWVTRAEMEAGLKADFAKADINHDGRLDPDEVRAVNLQRWSADASTASPLVDWNHDGFVDYGEYAATARSLFDQLDTDGDGKLSPKELKPGRSGGPSRKPHDDFGGYNDNPMPH